MSKTLTQKTRSKDIKEVNKQQLQHARSLGDITYYDRLLQSDNYIPKQSPTIDDFMRYGFLIHAGDLTIECTNSINRTSCKQPTIIPTNFLSYWSLNTPTIMSSTGIFRVGCSDIVIKPLIRCIDHLSNISAPEIMLAGNIVLEPGDIVVFDKNRPHKYNAHISYPSPVTHENLFIPAEKFAKKLQKYGIISVTYDAGSCATGTDFAELAKLVVYTILKELGAWQIEFDKELFRWTHKTGFKVNQSDSNPDIFFDAILEKFPSVSYGYDFYSSKGHASLFRAAAEIVLDREEVFQFIKDTADLQSTYFALKDFLFKELTSHIVDSTNYSDAVKMQLNQTLKYCFTENSVCQMRTKVTEEYTSIDGIINFTIRLSKEIFESFKPILKQITTKDEYDLVHKVYQLINNYSDNNHLSTASLKSSLKDQISDDNKFILFFQLEENANYCPFEHTKSSIEYWKNELTHWFDDISPT